jgi:hypothetical protein
MALIYHKGAELPDAQITWRDSAGAIINFSSGYTFTVKIGNAGQTALLTKTTGITGAATEPNITVAWAVNDLNGLTPDTYEMDIIANFTATSKDRIQSAQITILDVVT